MRRNAKSPPRAERESRADEHEHRVAHECVEALRHDFLVGIDLYSCLGKDIFLVYKNMMRNPPDALIQHVTHVEGTHFNECRLCPLGVWYRLNVPSVRVSDDTWSYTVVA